MPTGGLEKNIYLVLETVDYLRNHPNQFEIDSYLWGTIGGIKKPWWQVKDGEVIINDGWRFIDGGLRPILMLGRDSL